MATRSRSNTDSSIPSPMEDYREMPIDVEGLEDPLRPRTLPRPQFKRPPRILEMADEGIRVVMNGRYTYVEVFCLGCLTHDIALASFPGFTRFLHIIFLSEYEQNAKVNPGNWASVVPLLESLLCLRALQCCLWWESLGILLVFL